MTINPQIYLASPLGFSEIGRTFMYEKIIPSIEKLNYQVLDPWKLTNPDLIQEVLALPESKQKLLRLRDLNKIIGENNITAIKKCSGLFAVLDGVDIDSGTASEIGYASALKKPILGYRNDFRLCSDNQAAKVNLQVEYFIYLNGGKIITQINELEEGLKFIFKN